MMTSLLMEGKTQMIMISSMDDTVDGMKRTKHIFPTWEWISTGYVISKEDNLELRDPVLWDRTGKISRISYPSTTLERS